MEEDIKALQLSLRPLSAPELQQHHEREAYIKNTNDRRAKLKHARTVETCAFTAWHRCKFPPAKANNGNENPHRQLSGGVPQHTQPKPRPRPLDPANEEHKQQHGLGTWDRQHANFEVEIADQERRAARTGLDVQFSYGDVLIPRTIPPVAVLDSTSHYFPRALDLATEERRQQYGLGTWHRQHANFEVEIADQKRRAARTGLDVQLSYGEGVIPQTIPPLAMPDSTSHLFPRACAPNERSTQQMQAQPKAQKRQSETPACGQWVRELTNDAMLKARAGHEAGQRVLAQVKREQQKVKLPAAKPGNLYPGPSRISGILSPTRILQGDNTEQSIMSELAVSVHLKSKMASQEAYRKYQEEKKRKKEKDEERKAALSVPRPVATRTESVKQLLVSVNKVLEQQVETAPVEVAKTEGVELEALRAQSQQPHKEPEDAYEAGLKCGESFWNEYDKSYPIPRQSDGIHRFHSLGSALVQALTASPDHSLGAEESARHTGIPQTEVPLDSSRTTNLRAAVEAIDKTTGDLLESPKTASGQREPPLPEPSTVSSSRNRETCVVNVEGPSLVTHKDSSVKVPGQDVSPLSIPQAKQTDLRSRDKESVEDAVKARPLGDVDIQSEWQEVDDVIGDHEWCDVEQDFADSVWTGSSSSSDVEWASDVASEGAF